MAKFSEVLKSNPSCSIFLKALETAGMIENFNMKGPFTLFIPNNNAFSRLPKGTLEKLLADKTKLIHLLNYHVLPGKYMSKDALNLKAAKSLQKEELKFYNHMGKLGVNDANVIQADIPFTNGIIHIIDHVLMPYSWQLRKAA